MERDEWKSEDRFLYLNGEFSDEQTHQIVERLTQHWDREFLLVINSDGGSSFNALCVTNLMKAHARVDTLCVGVALSGAADVLAAGRRRFIVPGAIAMLHQVSWELGREYAGNLVKNARFLDRLNSFLADRLSEATGRPREELDRDMSTDFYLIGQEIIDYGLADAYWSPEDVLKPTASRRKPARIHAEASDTGRKKAQETDP